MADEPPHDVPMAGAPLVAVAAAAASTSRRSKRKKKACPSLLSHNPYQKQYDWQASKRRALNSPPLSPLKRFTPRSSRNRGRRQHQAASAAVALLFSDAAEGLRGGKDEDVVQRDDDDNSSDADS